MAQADKHSERSKEIAQRPRGASIPLDSVRGSSANKNFHAGQCVTVGVESNGDGGVPEQLLHELRMNVLREQERGAGVAEVLEGDPE